MTTLRISGISASKTLELVNELRKEGYINQIDFDFAFYPSINDRFSGPTKPSYVVFTFHKEELASFYGLKWINNEI